jgi:hypothetical protein
MQKLRTFSHFLLLFLLLSPRQGAMKTEPTKKPKNTKQKQNKNKTKKRFLPTGLVPAIEIKGFQTWNPV